MVINNAPRVINYAPREHLLYSITHYDCNTMVIICLESYVIEYRVIE